MSEQPQRLVHVTEQATLKVQQIEGAPGEVLALARRALQEDDSDPHSFMRRDNDEHL